jgi:hypothetical protein
MSLMYIMLAPLFGKALYDRVRMIRYSIRDKNIGATKVNVLFLLLILTVGTGLVFLLQRKDW